MITKEYTLSNDKTPIRNINLVIQTSKPIINSKVYLFDPKIVYTINLRNDSMDISKGIRTSSCSVNFDIDKYSDNLKCTYSDIKDISVKHKISKLYCILLFTSIILSFNSLLLLPLCFLSLFIGYYKYLDIELKSGEHFNIFFRNNDIKDINILKYFICKNGNVTFSKKQRIFGINKDLSKVMPFIIISTFIVNVLIEIIILKISPLYHNILFEILISKWC